MISTRNSTRTFYGPGESEVRAVDGIDLTVAREEVLAILGPNGAGKTTLMRMLTTLLPPTGGSAEIGGHDVQREPAQVRQVIGYVGQGNSAGHTQRAMDEVVTQARAAELAALARRTECVNRVTHTGTTVVAHAANGPKAVPALVTAAHARGIEVVSAATRVPTLDDVFLELTGRSLRDPGTAESGNHDPEETR